jgi:hypothetical protein
VEIDAGSMTSAVLISSWATFEGGLMYQLRRKRVIYDGQFESTSTLLFIAWKSYGYKELCALVQLMECDETFRWYEIRLKEYYQKYASQLSTYPITTTWLMIDGTVLITRLELDFTQRESVLNISISEGIRNERTKRSIWINPER